jgi:hypothetical protein
MGIYLMFQIISKKAIDEIWPLVEQIRKEKGYFTIHGNYIIYTWYEVLKQLNQQKKKRSSK